MWLVTHLLSLAMATHMTWSFVISMAQRRYQFSEPTNRYDLIASGQNSRTSLDGKMGLTNKKKVLLQNDGCCIITTLIVSRDFYSNTPAQHCILSDVQVKSGVASWAMICCVLLLTHSLIYEGINLPGVANGKEIKMTNYTYAENIDTWAGLMYCGCGHEVADGTTYHLAMSAQSWLDLQDVIAAYTAFHK